MPFTDEHAHSPLEPAWPEYTAVGDPYNEDPYYPDPYSRA